MANIRKRISRTGEITYSVNIRRKDIDVCKTFFDEEDAKMYIWYKERLIDNMKNFEVPLSDRITLQQVFEMKISTIPECNRKAISDMNMSKNRLCEIFGKNKFLHEISFEDWVNAAKKLCTCDVFRGAKTENSKRKMSTSTLRKIFAYASSSISYALKKGLNFENHPLKVMQTYINELQYSELAQR